MLLCDLPSRQNARVVHVEGTVKADPLVQRLRDVGFVPGEQVSVIVRGPWGGDPILVQVGGSRFALRRNEAKMIDVEVSA